MPLYVDNLSIWLDLEILWLTVRKIVAREGISQAGQATMEEFRGTAEQAIIRIEPQRESQYFTNLTRGREEREENHLHLRGFAPLREAKS